MVTEQEMLLIYALMNAMPEKTPEKRFAAARQLADMMGIDLFGQAEQPEPYVSTNVRPSDVSWTERTYGQDKAWAHVFDAIDSGLTPEQAIADATAAGYKFTFPSETDDQTRNVADPYRIASDYARERFDIESALAEYGQRENISRQQYEAEQANRPRSSADLFKTAADRYREQTGEDMSVESLMQNYRRAIAPTSGKAGMVGAVGPQGRVQAPEADPFQFSVVPERQKAFQQAFERKLGGTVERAQQTLTPEAQDMMRQLAMMAMLRGGM